ncbi:MAG TPA: proteasome accessory factor PafA2 family protein [Capsulimonadaceae bacterium]|jgi:proteasome accessory factor A
MDKRIFGIETEFGCLIKDDSIGNAEQVVEIIKDHAFYKDKVGVIDLHARDYAFEPARCGGFLRSGGRLYIDAVGSHMEYATPECTDFVDAVRYDKAGRVMLQRFLRELELEDKVSFHSNSVDHFGGHTFGCHENYLVGIDDRSFLDALATLLPFLVTRQIFAGVGRVGGHRLNYKSLKNNIMTISDYEVDYQWVGNFYGVEVDPTIDYQLSQRADHIVKTISGRVRFNRAIINPKWDSYYNYSNLHRLHILFGECNMSEYATLMKVGTTSIVLDLIESGIPLGDTELADPLEALKTVSRDPSWKWTVRLKDGSTIGAVDLQRIYLARAIENFKGRDEQTDYVLAEWEDTLNKLETDPMQLVDKLDWVAKRKMIEDYMEAEPDVRWGDDILHSIDLEYHNVDPATGLYYGLEQSGLIKRETNDLAIIEATLKPPTNTRAKGRGVVIEKLLAQSARDYVIDWDLIYINKRRYLELKNPFSTYEEEATQFASGL